MEVKEGNIVFDTYIGNSHITAGDGCTLRNEDEVREWLAKNLRVTICDDHIIRDENGIREQLVKAEQTIYNGLPKINKG